MLGKSLVSCVNLSKLQSRALRMLAQGMTTQGISEEFGVSEITVQLILNSCVSVLGANTLCHAVAIFLTSDK